MIGIRFILVWLAIACWSAHAFAEEYPFLEEKDLYVGVATIVFSGDTVAGVGDSDFLSGIQVSGLLEEFSWQAFWAASWDEDAMLAGGALDFYVANNFDDFHDASCRGCPEDRLWWVGAGPSVVSYREMLVDATGASVDGEELGFNVGGGYHFQEMSIDARVNYFPESENTMISIGLSHEF